MDLWFSIARGNDRHRDRVGKNSQSAFLNVHFQQVYDYVMWDLLQNTFFCCDSILLRQGPQGVPIGGFLSAQIMVLWAIFCESVLLDRDSSQKHMQTVNEGLSRKGLPHCTFTPGPQLTFPKDIVLFRRRDFFACYGMRGWFDQQHKILGWVRLGDVSFALQVPGLWDSFPSGRFGHIIAAAPKRARPLLTAHFDTLNPRDVMLAETTFPKSCLPDPALVTQAGPTVLLSRFMDNNYIGYVDFSSADACQQVVQFTQVFLDTLYNIPMKWEPSGPVNDWCESRVVTSPELALLMKGVTFQPPDTDSPEPDLLIWDRWVDRESPNARSVLHSMLPKMAGTALTYAQKELHMQINVASIVRGCAYKAYPRSWWWPPPRTTMRAAHKEHLLPTTLVSKWVGEGRAFRTAFGPASAAHFAPALRLS